MREGSIGVAWLEHLYNRLFISLAACCSLLATSVRLYLQKPHCLDECIVRGVTFVIVLNSFVLVRHGTAAGKCIHLMGYFSIFHSLSLR